MTDKASSPAGWVVQATIAGEPEVRAPDAPWRSDAMLVGPPLFRYFNVAIAAPDKAIEAATRYLAKDAEAKAGEMSVVRKLSSAEVAALRLKTGEVKPA
jgi:hypothetical protein